MEEGDCADLCAYSRVDADYCGERKVKSDPAEDGKRVAYWKHRFAGTISKAESRDAKLQRERERAASRMALEEMEKTTVIYNSHDIMRDYQRLISTTPPYRPINWPMFLQSNGISIT
ncbi:hypothetical protein MKX01_026071 [Papaver californicum]|nr:hypothetical protein MKX01_026071 [Papaver californicum]